MVSRRSFLSLGARAAAIAATTVTSGGALAASNKKRKLPLPKDFSSLGGAKRKAVPSACWQCVSRCPIIGFKEGDKLVKIEGQPNSIRSLGKICAKSQAGINQVYDPDRILYPMRRVGKRGEGKWKRITWDEALSELTGKLKDLRDREPRR